MATENFYEQNGWVIGHVDALADTNDFDVTPADWGVSNVKIETYIVGGSCDLKYLADAAGDFSAPDTNITFDSFSGAGISEGNEMPLQQNRTTLRITNTSGSAADFIVVGHELPEEGDD